MYRARDTLNREVAIKVLPAAFSSDTERLRRFEQEAQAAGGLNHRIPSGQPRRCRPATGCFRSRLGWKNTARSASSGAGIGSRWCGSVNQIV